jgi:hypothetical protein
MGQRPPENHRNLPRLWFDTRCAIPGEGARSNRISRDSQRAQDGGVSQGDEGDSSPSEKGTNKEVNPPLREGYHECAHS